MASADDLSFSFHSVTVTGNGYSFSGQPLTVTGDLNVEQGGSLELDNSTTVSGTGTVAASAVLTIGANGILNDQGTVAVAPNGTLTLVGGTLIVPQLVVLQGGTVNGPGSISGDVSNAGQINPGLAGAAGLLTVNGNYTQTATGVLHIQIGGANPGTDYDQLSITGMASLGGTLNVSLINSFVPTSGATFQILTFGSWDGSTFTTLNLDPLFQNPVTYDPLDVTLVAN